MTRRTVLRIILAVIGAAILAVLPWVLPSFYTNLLVLIAIYGFVTTGLVLLIGYGGLISLGHGAFFGIGAYAAAILAGTLGLNPWLSLVAGTLITALSAYLSGLPLLRLSGHYLGLATLAWNIIVTTLLVQMIGLTGGANGFSNVPTLSFFGIDLLDAQHFYYLVVPIAILGVLMLGVLLTGRTGRAIRASRSSEVAARSLGVNVARLKLQVFVISAAFAGLGGGLFAYFIAFIGPTTFNIDASIQLLTMTLIGGAHPLGGLVGAGIILIVNNFLQDILQMLGQPGQVQVIVYGAILVVLMILSPKGLAPVLKYLWNPSLRVKNPPKPDALPAPLPATLQVNEMSRNFGGLIAVDKLSLTVKSGEIVALIGPNGAGKTTAFNLVSGVLRPSSGHIALNDEDVTHRPAREMARLGLTRTFQNTALFDMSVLENVMMGCYLRTRGGLVTGLFGLRRGDQRRAMGEALRILDRVGTLVPDHLADTLSVGQRRLLEVARALAVRPNVLLLDEPAAGLRAAEKRELSDLLRSLRDDGLAILLVEHDMDVVMNLADRIVVMNYGKTLASGLPDEVANNEQVIEAYLGSDVT